jgi:AsmA protein
MKAFVKWAAIALACLVIVVAAALLIIPRFIDAKPYKADLENFVSQATGRSFSVGGDVSLSLIPWAGASFKDIALGCPPGFDEKTFLSVESFDVRVKLWPLLVRREVLIDRLNIQGPRVFLVTRADGRSSWDFSRSAAGGPKPDPGPPDGKTDPAGLPVKSLSIGELSLTNGRLQIVDHKSGSRSEIAGLNLTLRDVALDRPMTLALEADFNSKPVRIAGRIGPAAGATGPAGVPLDLKASVFGHMNVQLRGRIENLPTEPRAELEVEVPEFSPRRLLEDLGQAPLETADPQALAQMSFRAVVRADRATASLSDGRIDLDQSKLTFALKAREFSKPDLAFELDLDRMDLDRYLPPQAKGGADSAAGRPGAAPPKKKDYAPLRRLVLDGTVRVGQLVAAKAEMQDIRLKLVAKNGVFSLDPFDLKLYQGQAGGKAAVSVADETPATSIALNLAGVQANPLVRDLAGKDVIAGTLRAALDLRMKGEEPERIKKTLNGKGELEFRDGAVIGVDLAGMVRNVKSALTGAAPAGTRPRTDFSELNVPFTLQDGVFHTPATSLQSPLIRLQAAGQANLVQETLDFRVEPKLVATLKGQGDTKAREGLAVPVIVSGSFADPSFRPDLAGMAKEELKGLLDPSGGSGQKPSLKEKAGGLIKGILPPKN